MELTGAGPALLSAPQKREHEWAGFEQKIRALPGLTQRRLRVAVASTAKYFVPGMLGAFFAPFSRLTPTSTSRFKGSIVTG